MFGWLLHAMRSPYLLLIILGLGCLVGGFVLSTAFKRGGGGSGIDAARIHQMRNVADPQSLGEK